MSQQKEYFGVIEAGGTKFNCAIVDKERNVLSYSRIPTQTAKQTLSNVVDFFNAQKAKGYSFSKLGLACFGPLDLNNNSDTYGNITQTPKADWSDTPIKTVLEQKLSCDVFIDTDVNGAALAEHRWGAGQGAKVLVYITVGTGIGGGLVINGQPIHGAIHPEMGHMLIPQTEVKSVCPFHENCIEGAASGKAMAFNWGDDVKGFPLEHQAWQIESDLLSILCHNLLVMLSPEKIIMGGGVMSFPGLLEQVVLKTEKRLNGYLKLPSDKTIVQIIQAPQLGDDAGLFGAFALIEH